MSYNYGFHATAKLMQLSFGCKTDWYIHDNEKACEEQVPRKRIGNKMWPQGWFALVEYTNHNEMRDFGVDEKNERTVAGPFPTEAEALKAAAAGYDEVVAALK